MGTRALIRFGKETIATHWDGYPEGLGKDLLELPSNPTLDAVIGVADKHGIDFATKAVLELTNMPRFEFIAKKANDMLAEKGEAPKYTAESLNELYEKEGKILQFGIMGAGDYPITPFDKYDDWAEYEYVIEEKGIKCRELHGSYLSATKGRYKPVEKFFKKDED